jgi:hypothetical protein
MRRVVTAVSAAALAIGVFAGPTLAAAPANPGCFGLDRAAYIQGTLNTGDPGASEVGVILAGRAGDNGTINRDYRTACGGDPTS